MPLRVTSEILSIVCASAYVCLIFTQIRVVFVMYAVVDLDFRVCAISLARRTLPFSALHLKCLWNSNHIYISIFTIASSVIMQLYRVCNACGFTCNICVARMQSSEDTHCPFHNAIANGMGRGEQKCWAKVDILICFLNFTDKRGAQSSSTAARGMQSTIGMMRHLHFWHDRHSTFMVHGISVESPKCRTRCETKFDSVRFWSYNKKVHNRIVHALITYTTSCPVCFTKIRNTEPEFSWSFNPVPASPLS